MRQQELIIIDDTDGYEFEDIMWDNDDMGNYLGIALGFVNMNTGLRCKHAVRITSPYTPRKIARALRDLAHWCETNTYLKGGK